MTAGSRLPTGAGTQFLVAAASFVIVVAGLREASQLVLPFLVAVFLAVVSVPFMRWLHRLGLPLPLAVLSTVLAAIGVISLLVMLIGQSVNEFAVAAPRYQDRLQALMELTLDLLEGYGVPITGAASLDLLPVGIFDVLGTALGAVTSFASRTFLVLLTVIFILMEAAGFSGKLQRAFGDETDLGQFERMTQQVQKYLVIKTAMSAITGTLVGLWAALMGLDFALLWGVTAFLLNFIPNLGSIIAAVPAVLLAVVQFGPGRAAAIAVGYLVINVVFGSLLEPMLLGRRLGLSTLVVFVSLVFWGWVWGPIGMLFSVPLTMTIKIALENTQDLKWIAVMLDANPSSRRLAAVEKAAVNPSS